MKEDRIRTEIVHLLDLDANPWNPNRMDEQMFQKEIASLRKFGYVNPIIVRRNGTRYQIIDGEHRKKALIKLGVVSKVPVTVISDLNDSDAKQLTIVLNETRGRSDPAKMGELLKDLLSVESKTDLLDILPYSPPVFEKLAGLAPLDWDQVDPVPKSGGWIERTYRMPREAAEVLDSAIAKAKEGEEMDEWQALEMVAAEFLAG